MARVKQDVTGARTAEHIDIKYGPIIAGLQKASKNSAEGLNKTNKTLENFVNQTVGKLDDLQEQIDGNVTTYFYSGIPTLLNAPANEWTTDEEKEKHLDDLYYDKDTGKPYIFTYQDDKYQWIQMSDNGIAQALAVANTAKDTADGKRRVFTARPTPPYDIGDLWFNKKEIYICAAAKVDGENFEDVDFVPGTNYTGDELAKKVRGDLAEFMGKVEADYSTTVEMQSEIAKSEEKITAAVSKTITETADVLQKQIDGAIETHTGSIAPTLSNKPAKEWTTDEEKDKHLGDLYIVDSEGGDQAGFYYRFQKNAAGTYQWVLLKDNEITKALQDAKEANDKAAEIEKNIEENYSTTVQMKAEIKTAADEINMEVSKKVGSNEIIAKINMSAESVKIAAEMIDLVGKVTAQMLNVDSLSAICANLGEVNAGKINGCIFKAEGQKVFKAEDYTSEDTTICRELMTGTREVLPEYLEKYDFTGKGYLSALDYVKMQKLVTNAVQQFTLDLNLEINALEKNAMLKTEGVSIGMNGMYSKSVMANESRINKMYAKVEGEDIWRVGQTGMFTDANGNGIIVVNGIITSPLNPLP